MKVRKLTQEDIPELIRFGQEMYPERKDTYAKLIHFVMDNRIGDYTGGIILCDDNNKIVGQSIDSSTQLWYEGIFKEACWAYDLIIEEKYRKDAWGIEVMIANGKKFPNSCATGSNPTALKINLKLGCSLIGELKKYVGLSSILHFPLHLFPVRNFYPSEINGFKLIKDYNNYKYKKFFNYELLEPSRDLSFIKWRYFSPGFKEYKLYQNKEGEWFVVRHVKYKLADILIVSDFRCCLDNTASFHNIYKAIKKIANKKRIPFILCGSSHINTDNVLKKNNAISIGRPRPIIFSKSLRELLDSKKIKQRNYCFITLGDSDGEWNL